MEHHNKRIVELTERLPPLPNFSHFHPKFRLSDTTEEGKNDISLGVTWCDILNVLGVLRDAYYAASEENCAYVHLKDERLNNLRGDWSMVAACFVIPYPPGFPILVPGQIITDDVINFFRHLVPFSFPLR